MRSDVQFWEDVWKRPALSAESFRDVCSVEAIKEDYGGRDRYRIMELLGLEPAHTVLEVGCGDGDWTMLFAKYANAYALDRSRSAVDLLQQRLRNFNLQGQVDCGDITAMPYPAERFDRIFGSMILHHIKDFDSLGRELARVLKPTGKAVFWENSGENPLLRFARNHLAGRSWLGFKIPKFGDYEEEPLRRSSIEVLAQKIGSYELHFNQCVFFRVFDIYISRGRIPGVKQLCSSLDRVAARTPFRKYGYLQIVEFIKR